MSIDMEIISEFYQPRIHGARDRGNDRDGGCSQTDREYKIFCKGELTAIKLTWIDSQGEVVSTLWYFLKDIGPIKDIKIIEIMSISPWYISIRPLDIRKVLFHH